MKYILSILLTFCLLACHSTKVAKNSPIHTTETLIVQKVAEHVYQHISFLNTESFGKVACNGMIVVDKKEAIIFDTPAHTKSSEELIQWIEDSLNCKVKAIIPTHFHDDCLGGLDAFHKKGIPSFANNLTIQFARRQNVTLPQNGFDSQLELKVGSRKVITEFLGEGHTRDNVIGYFPDEKIMFGGCLIKEVGAGKGNLADANVNEWSQTVTQVKAKYPGTKVIIPGHGKSGGTELLDYTIKLFEKK
ncbi:subclass B1 metallo-beta-lactamase [Cytophagaceae bacterium BD1B2-1]|uniref:Beta-lactamase n=1 Tax=Xanthocytophaga agilis TaxID=3048010 RepID=A0AAE3UI64_9BACT|nr:subclass B1 metallo-beta-lactamase [Xanthocytophaga agilis]MDJ1504242.1 subclass B1 metallo-beta-lactamase [Xanthocytophaga agilis]